MSIWKKQTYKVIANLIFHKIMFTLQTSPSETKNVEIGKADETLKLYIQINENETTKNS